MLTSFQNEENERFNDESFKALNEILKSIKQAFEIELPKQHKLLFNELSRTGWYIDYNLAPKTLASLLCLDYKNKTILDNFLIQHFHKQISTIREIAITSFPSRKHILDSAFKAHTSKQYELSIPVFLSQIDGICFELIGKDIFSKGRGKKKENIPKKWVEKLDKDNLSLSMLEQLSDNILISASFAEAEQYPFVINRNLILHGRITDYGTKKNSLKVISMLNYVITIVTDIKRDDGKLSWL